MMRDHNVYIINYKWRQQLPRLEDDTGPIRYEGGLSERAVYVLAPNRAIAEAWVDTRSKHLQDYVRDVDRYGVIKLDAVIIEQVW